MTAHCAAPRIQAWVITANLVWNEDNLDRFLADPDGTLPGHNMKPYGGIASEDARRLIIEHLMAHQ